MAKWIKANGRLFNADFLVSIYESDGKYLVQTTINQPTPFVAASLNDQQFESLCGKLEAVGDLVDLDALG